MGNDHLLSCALLPHGPRPYSRQKSHGLANSSDPTEKILFMAGAVTMNNLSPKERL